MNGELPLSSPPKVAVILIGTNDLGAVETCMRNGSAELEAAAGTSSRLNAHVSLALQYTSSYIFLAFLHSNRIEC